MGREEGNFETGEGRGGYGMFVDGAGYRMPAYASVCVCISEGVRDGYNESD